MKILFAASEAHPLIKTGGLADVAGSLPPALKSARHDVRLILPAYRTTLARALSFKLVAVLDELPGSDAPVRLFAGRLPGSNVTAYLVDAPELFDRDGGPYLDPEGLDWSDNAERFALFNRVIVELAQDRLGLGWRPKVVHCNDWQTGLAPALLSLEWPRPATVFTIHNLAYRGLFPAEALKRLELPAELWSLHGMEFFGGLSFIKGGLAYADWITTVSPTYAEEIRTPDFGWAMEGLLSARAGRLTGILNGIDYEEWDPQNDPFLPAHYSVKEPAGKALCKAELQRRFELPEEEDTPLLGHVGRLVDQKGIDLLIRALPQLNHHRLQIVILGAGDKWYEKTLRDAAARHPERLAVRIGYDEELAHLVEAGSDIFLMPSRFEPCGLNQIYSLRYGAVPVVRRTGGLADTVDDVTEESLAADEATGFLFDEPSSDALHHAVERALELYADPVLWAQVRNRGMKRKFDWEHSAQAYIALYRQAVESLEGG
ncbi:glycogen synthase GlgA [Endothiovibrio diazotrophicus]